MKNIYNNNIITIHNKVKLLLNKKDMIAKDLKKQLLLLKDKSNNIQDTLDKIRAQQYAGIGGTNSDLTDSSEWNDIKFNIVHSNIDIDKGKRTLIGTGTNVSTKGAGAGDSTVASNSSNRRSSRK